MAPGIFQILQFYNLFSFTVFIFLVLHYSRNSGFHKALKEILNKPPCLESTHPAAVHWGKYSEPIRCLTWKARWIPHWCDSYGLEASVEFTGKNQPHWFFHFSNTLPYTCCHQFCSCLVSLPSLFGCSVSEVQHGVVLPLHLLCFHQAPWKKPLNSSRHSPPCQCWSVLAAALAEWLGCFLQLWKKPV